LPAPADPRAPDRGVDPPGRGRRRRRLRRGLAHPRVAPELGTDGRLHAVPRPARQLPDVTGRGRRRTGDRPARRPRGRRGARVERVSPERGRGAPAALLAIMALPLAYNVRNLLVRRWTSAFTIGGVALVVAAAMLLAALVGGLQQMLVSTGEPENLIVLRKGSTSDGSS